jgi:hypothetical protein
MFANFIKYFYLFYTFCFYFVTARELGIDFRRRHRMQPTITSIGLASSSSSSSPSSHRICISKKKKLSKKKSLRYMKKKGEKSIEKQTKLDRSRTTAAVEKAESKHA